MITVILKFPIDSLKAVQHYGNNFKKTPIDNDKNDN